MTSDETKPFRVLLCASARDPDAAEQACAALAPMTQSGQVVLRATQAMVIGQNRAQLPMELLAAADALLVLLSPEYLAESDELPTMLQAAAQRRLPILPVVWRYCVWEHVPSLAELQPALADGKPLMRASAAQRERAWVRIADRIRGLVQQTRGAGPARNLAPPIPAGELHRDRGRRVRPMTLAASLTAMAVAMGTAGWILWQQRHSMHSQVAEENGQVRNVVTVPGQAQPATPPSTVPPASSQPRPARPGLSARSTDPATAGSGHAPIQVRQIGTRNYAGRDVLAPTIIAPGGTINIGTGAGSPPPTSTSAPNGAGPADVQPYGKPVQPQLVPPATEAPAQRASPGNTPTSPVSQAPAESPCTPNLLQNGDFQQDWTVGWTRRFSSHAAVNSPSLARVETGVGSPHLHLRFQGGNWMSVEQTVAVPAGQILIEADVEFSVWEGPILGFSGQGMAALSVLLLDRADQPLGIIRFGSYEDHFLAGTGLAGVPSGPADSGHHAWVKLQPGRLHHIRHNITEIIRERLAAVDARHIARVAVRTSVGGTAERAGAEAYVGAVSLRVCA